MLKLYLRYYPFQSGTHFIGDFFLGCDPENCLALINILNQVESSRRIRMEFTPVEFSEKIRKEMAGRTETGGGAADPSAISHHGHTLLFEEAVNAINENRPSILDGHEGRRSVEVICAVYESAKTGKVVTLG